MLPLDGPEPDLNPKLASEDKEMLTRAVEKWIKFHKAMWSQINGRLEKRINYSETVGLILRIAIIVISATLTTLSDWQGIDGGVIRLIAGLLTALTGIEAYLKLTERQSEARRQQRELEALRDHLRYQWFVEVEVQPDMTQRLEAAKKLLEEGPKQYNDILNKYSLKASAGEEPALSK